MTKTGSALRIPTPLPNINSMQKGNITLVAGTMISIHGQYLCILSLNYV